LVTDWRSASAKIEEQTNKVLLQTNNIDKQPKLNSLPRQPAVIEVYDTNVGTVNDYQVEAEIEDKIENKSNIELMAKPKELQLDNVEQVQTNVFIYSDSDVDMLLALPSGTFVIQIAAMADIEILQYYINDKQLSQQVWLYKTQRYAGDWYVLLKNQYFPTIEIARAEIINLTDGMLGNTPFVKSIRQVKQEISVSVP
jgi:DamX protein